jgi:hypothetical protein
MHSFAEWQIASWDLLLVQAIHDSGFPLHSHVSHFHVQHPMSLSSIYGDSFNLGPIHRDRSALKATAINLASHICLHVHMQEVPPHTPQPLPAAICHVMLHAEKAFQCGVMLQALTLKISTQKELGFLWMLLLV